MEIYLETILRVILWCCFLHGCIYLFWNIFSSLLPSLPLSLPAFLPFFFPVFCIFLSIPYNPLGGYFKVKQYFFKEWTQTSPEGNDISI